MEKKSLRVLAVIFLIVLGLVLFIILRDKQSSDALKFKNEYEAVNSNENAVKITISKNSPVKYLSYENLKQKIDSKDSFSLYLGFPTCPWCRNIINVLFDTAKENKNTVYYINVRELKQNSFEDYNDLYNLLYEYLEEDTDGEKVLYVPDVYFFNDGKVVGHHLGSVDSQTNPYESLTTEQTNELKGIYQELFNKIK